VTDTEQIRSIVKEQNDDMKEWIKDTMVCIPHCSQRHAEIDKKIIETYNDIKNIRTKGNIWLTLISLSIIQLYAMQWLNTKIDQWAPMLIKTLIKFGGI